MWKEHKEALNHLIHFLKIGHHGSINATPWKKGGENDEVNQIINAILPPPEESEKPIAQAIASTERSKVYKPIPAADLLVELGKRVKNTRNYYDELEARGLSFPEPLNFNDYWEYELKNCFKQPQPWRTDLEQLLTGGQYVDVVIEGED